MGAGSSSPLQAQIHCFRTDAVRTVGAALLGEQREVQHDEDYCHRYPYNKKVDGCPESARVRRFLRGWLSRSFQMTVAVIRCKRARRSVPNRRNPGRRAGLVSGNHQVFLLGYGATTPLADRKPFKSLVDTTSCRIPFVLVTLPCF